MELKLKSQKARGILKSRGIKVNLQRTKIVIAVHEIKKIIFTADDITSQLLSEKNIISRSCIYYTLIELANTGVLKKYKNNENELEFSLNQ